MLRTASDENATEEAPLEATPDAAPAPAPEAPTPEATTPEAPAPEPEPSPDPALAPSPDPAPANETPEAPAPAVEEPPAENATSEEPAAPTPDAPAPDAPTPAPEGPQPPAPEPEIAVGQPTLSADDATVMAGAQGTLLHGAVSGARGIVQVRVLVVGEGVSAVVGAIAVAPEDLSTLSEPEAFAPEGFRLWSPDGGETLAYTYRFAPQRGAATGERALALEAVPRHGDAMRSDTIHVDVEPFQEVATSASPVDANGTTQNGVSWGTWAARPGSSDVAATNYIRLQNAGDTENLTVVLDFDAGGFVGQSDPRFVIPTQDNLEWAWWQAPNETSDPGDGTWAFHAGTSRTGDTIEFHGHGAIVFVAYRILHMPEVLPAQAYRAPFTVTEV